MCRVLLEKFYSVNIVVINIQMNHVVCYFADGFRWSHDAILAFLEVYKEHEHLITSGSTMKKFWNVIATELNNKGYNLTDSQCKSKMAGLRNTYTSIKDYNGKHSYCNRRWRYFDVSAEDEFYVICIFYYNYIEHYYIHCRLWMKCTRKSHGYLQF